MKIFLLSLFFLLFLSRVECQTSKVLMPSNLRWKQTFNNDGGCPGYNNECKSLSGGDCDKADLGCGAVAIGMIMYYWQWPPKDNLFNLLNTYTHELYYPPLIGSADGRDWPASFPWNKIKPQLRSYDDVTPDAHFLVICGLSIFSGATSWGTYATIDNIRNALNDIFYFKGATIVSKSDYNDSEWDAILRNEIDNGRPVLYFGKQHTLSDWHYFVLHGYLEDNGSYSYMFNFGQGGGNSSFLTLGATGFPGDQQAIIHIQPDCDAFYDNAIFNHDIPDGMMYGDYAKTMYVYSKTVKSGGSLILQAGNSVSLRPGFHAEAGSSFLAKPRNCSVSDLKSASERNVDDKLLSFLPSDNVNEVNVFPNPSHDIFNIYISEINLPCDLYLYDMNGKIVWSLLNNRNNLNRVALNNLPRGVFFLKLFSNNTTICKKLIIN